MFIIIRLKDNQSINPFYIKRFLESPVGQYYFEVNQSGTVATVLTPNDLKSIQLPLISIDKQEEMIEQLRDADDLIRKAYEERNRQYLEAYNRLSIGSAIQIK